MLTRMIEGWALWVLLVGFATGVALTAVFLWRLPRREDDVAVGERPAEARWIARVIEADGGVAPEPFVEEVLELHQAYLASRFTPGPPAGVAPPPAFAPPGGYPPQGAGTVPPAGYAPQPTGYPPQPAGYAPPPGPYPPQGPGAPPPGR